MILSIFYCCIFKDILQRNLIAFLFCSRDVYKWVNPESAAATGAYHSQQNSNSHSRQQQQQQQQQQDVGGGGGHLESKDLLHHPVYRELSRINGGINRMDLGELKRRCKELRLDCAGKREAVKRRLKVQYLCAVQARLDVLGSGLPRETAFASPCWPDRKGKWDPHLINGRGYQSRLPSRKGKGDTFR